MSNDMLLSIDATIEKLIEIARTRRCAVYASLPVRFDLEIGRDGQPLFYLDGVHPATEAQVRAEMHRARTARAQLDYRK